MGTVFRCSENFIGDFFVTVEVMLCGRSDGENVGLSEIIFDLSEVTWCFMS